MISLVSPELSSGRGKDAPASDLEQETQGVEGGESKEADRGLAPDSFRQNGKGVCVLDPRTGFRDPVLALTFPGLRSASSLGVARSVNE